METKSKALLIILDGYGVSNSHEGNAIYSANPEFINKLFSERPYTTLAASGLEVGLPAGQMGNSEVGHLNIGAGRIVYQDITRINKAIEDGTLLNFDDLEGLPQFENATAKNAAIIKNI